MTLAVPLERTELHQVLEREITALGHQRVDDRRHVTDRELPHVAVRPLGIRGIDVHLVEEHRRAEIAARERPAAVPRLRLAEQRDDVAADVLGLRFELLDRPLQAARLVSGLELGGRQGGGGHERVLLGNRWKMSGRKVHREGTGGNESQMTTATFAERKWP